jgi:hypothetical protein
MPIEVSLTPTVLLVSFDLGLSEYYSGNPLGISFQMDEKHVYQ